MTNNDFSTYKYADLTNDDILVCALGYECRSYYLLEKNLATRNSSNTLIINFDDLQKERIPNDLLCEIDSLTLKTETCSYAQGEKFQNAVLAFLEETIDIGTSRKVYIDYSAMPRNWYCALPGRIAEEIQNRFLELVFLYVAGIYPEKYEIYPTAGIDRLKLFSGGALPRIDSQRTHLIALSYDTRRTQSLLSMLEPEFLIVCYAYDTPEKKDEIENVNRDIIRRASASVALPINDFVYIMQKMNEIIMEQTRNGQIIIIPDGPKPLIFAMSLSSVLANLDDDITCLHVNRNERLVDSKVKVLARENEVYGVRISINNIGN